MRQLVALVLFALAGCATDPPTPSADQEAVFAETVEVELVVTTAKNAMRYETLRIEAPEGARVRLVLDNRTTTSPSMLHNAVVLAPDADVDAIGRAAAGLATFVPDDPAVIAATPIARPQEQTAVVFTMPAAGVYPFVCTYPGHYQFMRGELVSTPRPAEG